jgi:predicted Fe-Mo cluster-binding NifX family protein
MKYRVGIATTDGLVVNQHFGRAESFLIADVDEQAKIEVIEQRFLQPVCEGGEHDENRLEENILKLSDCQYILVSRIGEGARYQLEKKNIAAYEIPGLIEDAVKKLTAYIEIQNMLG